MSEINIDYIGEVKKILKDNNLYAECFDNEHSSTIETGTTKVKKFRMSFKITINEDGWLYTTCPMAGKIPDLILEDFMEEMLSQMGHLSSLKFYVDKSGMLMASHEMPMPANIELLEPEVFNSMSVLDMAYELCLPKLMLMYWRAAQQDGGIH